MLDEWDDPHSMAAFWSGVIDKNGIYSVPWKHRVEVGNQGN